MIVAAAAVQREAEPSEAGGLHAVNDVFDAPLLGDDAALAIEAVVAVEAGGHDLFAGGIGQQVTADLFERELIEGLVVVEGLDDPVAPGPHGAAAVGLEAVAIGKAGEVEPLHGHALAVVLGFQEAVHHLFVGLWRCVFFKGGDLLQRGRQAGEIERDAAQQRGAVGLGGRVELFLLQALGDEGVDGIADGEYGIFDLRHGSALGLEEGPVALILGALGDPLAQDGLFFGGERLAVFVRRHHVIVTVGQLHAGDELALFRLTGDEGDVSGFGGL